MLIIVDCIFTQYKQFTIDYYDTLLLFPQFNRNLMRKFQSLQSLSKKCNKNRSKQFEIRCKQIITIYNPKPAKLKPLQPKHQKQNIPQSIHRSLKKAVQRTINKSEKSNILSNIQLIQFQRHFIKGMINLKYFQESLKIWNIIKSKMYLDTTERVRLLLTQIPNLVLELISQISNPHNTYKLVMNNLIQLIEELKYDSVSVHCFNQQIVFVLMSQNSSKDKEETIVKSFLQILEYPTTKQFIKISSCFLGDQQKLNTSASQLHDSDIDDLHDSDIESLQEGDIQLQSSFVNDIFDSNQGTGEINKNDICKSKVSLKKKVINLTKKYRKLKKRKNRVKTSTQEKSSRSKGLKKKAQAKQRWVLCYITSFTHLFQNLQSLTRYRQQLTEQIKIHLDYIVQSYCSFEYQADEYTIQKIKFKLMKVSNDLDTNLFKQLQVEFANQFTHHITTTFKNTNLNIHQYLSGVKCIYNYITTHSNIQINRLQISQSTNIIEFNDACQFKFSFSILTKQINELTSGEYSKQHLIRIMNKHVQETASNIWEFNYKQFIKEIKALKQTESAEEFKIKQFSNKIKQIIDWK